MLTFPAETLKKFDQRFGNEIFLVAGIQWAGDAEILYSTQEFTSDLGTVYKYVKENGFTGLSSLSQAEGFGTINEVTIAFYDFYAHLKEKLDKKNVLNKTTTVNIYLGIISSLDTELDPLVPDGPPRFDPPGGGGFIDNSTAIVLTKLFDGTISNPIYE